MTREHIVDILNEYKVRKFAIPRIADRILAALEKEREGEVVIGSGLVERIDMSGPFDEYPDYQNCINKDTIDMGKIEGKQGQLIFRPTKAKESGL